MGASTTGRAVRYGWCVVSLGEGPQPVLASSCVENQKSPVETRSRRCESPVGCSPGADSPGEGHTRAIVCAIPRGKWQTSPLPNRLGTPRPLVLGLQSIGLLTHSNRATESLALAAHLQGVSVSQRECHLHRQPERPHEGGRERSPLMSRVVTATQVSVMASNAKNFSNDARPLSVAVGTLSDLPGTPRWAIPASPVEQLSSKGDV